MTSIKSYFWYFGESDVVEETNLVVLKAVEEGKVKKDSGALISTEEVDPPILITKSDGSYLYLTTDLGTVLFREKKNDFNKYIYVVDSRQQNHFDQLFKTVKHFGLSQSEFFHVGFGTINGPDNKPFKTRDGGVYKLNVLFEDIKEKLKKYNSEELVLNTLTNTVLTYSDLLPNRNQNYIFDVDKFTDINGKTGIYIQYAQVRARKLLDNSTLSGSYNIDLELNNDNNSVTSWTGQTLFWALIIFFLSLFILFLPIEFLNSTNLNNSSFNELVSNVIIVIGISLFFLATSQFFINADSLVINELKIIIRSVSFSGFIAIPLFLFILQSIGSKVNFFSKEKNLKTVSL